MTVARKDVPPTISLHKFKFTLHAVLPLSNANRLPAGQYSVDDGVALGGAESAGIAPHPLYGGKPFLAETQIRQA